MDGSKKIIHIELKSNLNLNLFQTQFKSNLNLFNLNLIRKSKHNPNLI